MRIGFLNLDNPYSSIAVEMSKEGHQVIAYDANAKLEKYFDATGEHKNFTFTTDLVKATKRCSYVFVLHQFLPERYYDGTAPMVKRGMQRQNLTHLIETFTELSKILKPSQTVILIGNVPPRTTRQLQELIPAPILYLTAGENLDTEKINAREQFCSRYLEQNFPVYIGTPTGETKDKSFIAFDRDFAFCGWTGENLVNGTWEDIELLNMCCRTFDAMNQTFVNTVQHLCAKIGADTRFVLRRIKKRTNHSFRAGIGLGCDYPQTLMDMSCLTNDIGLGYDPFSEMLLAREQQAKHIATKIRELGVNVKFGQTVPERHSSSEWFYSGRNIPTFYNSFIELVKHYVLQMGCVITEDIDETEVYVKSPYDELAPTLTRGWIGTVFDITEYYGRPIEHEWT